MAYTVLAWICSSISTAFWGSLSLLSSLFSKSGDFSHTCMRLWSRQNLRIARTKLHVDGYENITDDSPKIYAANHQSFVDILVLAATLPGKFRWIAKKELFRIPFLGWHMQRAKYISIDRSDRASAARSIMETVETLRRGISLVIFPEETRSPDGNLKEFKRGGFAVAVRAEVPIVPVVIEGTAGVLKRGDLRVHKADVYVRILKPLKPPLKKSKTAELELMESTRDAILKSLSEIRGT